MPLSQEKIDELDAIYGASSLTPEKIAELDRIYGQQGQDMGEGRAALQGFNAAVPFGNRMTAGLGAGIASLATDESFSDLYDEARRNQQATSEANPNAELAGMGAGILATLPAVSARALWGVTPTTGARGAVNAIPGALSKVGSFVRGGEVAEGAGRLARAGNLALRSGKAATVAAPVGALYGAGEAPEGEMLEGAGRGAGVASGVAGALPVIGAGAGATLAAVTPKIAEGLEDIVMLAQKYKIPLSFDQVSGSRALKTFQKASQDLPFSGQGAFREKQLLALQKNLFDTVGVKADMFNTKTMNMAFKKVGGEFDALTKGRQFNIGGEFIDDIAKSADEIESLYGKEAAEIFKKEAIRVMDDFKGDAIPGELISRQRSRINALARKANPGNKEALLELERAIVDGITSGDPALQKALSTAKQRYKNLIVLEPIANKAKGGFISPALLNQRVSQVYRRAHTIGESGEIGDLARIGHELLPELGGSDTAQKLFYYGATVPTGFIAPVTTAATLGANRAFQAAINRNQALIGKSLAKTQGRLPKEPTLKEIERMKPADAKAALDKYLIKRNQQ